MIYLYSFLCCGFFCLIAQIILDNTTLTSGHITVIFTMIGSILGYFGLYEKLLYYCNEGASVLISNFGYLLFKGVIEGYEKNSFIGMFSNILKYSSLAISSVIIISFILSIFFKAKS